MAEPARGHAPATGPTRLETRRLDPAAPGWAPVQNLVANAAEAAEAALAALAAHPDCPDAQRRVQMICIALTNLAELACAMAEAERGRVVDEAVLAAREEAAYRRGVEDCKARRCNLEVLDGGRDIPLPGLAAQLRGQLLLGVAVGELTAVRRRPPRVPVALKLVYLVRAVVVGQP